MNLSLLVLCPVSPAHREALSARYAVTWALAPEERAEAVASHGASFQAVLTIGTLGLTADEMARMPALQLVSCMGVGHELVDLAAARERGIVVTNGRGANDECLADHTLGLIIATMRNFRALDRQCRAGVWRTAIALPVNVSGKKLGILGLGAVGEKVAMRAQAFRMSIGYHNRRPRPESGYRYFDDVAALAAWCDILVCAAPGGTQTHHLVDAAVLRALGPAGFLVNVGRGSIVDTAALAHALEAGVIAGAGIDVYESEPAPPKELVALDNLLLTPHMGGWSPEAVDAQLTIFLQNIDGFFAGQGAVTPV